MSRQHTQVNHPHCELRANASKFQMTIHVCVLILVTKSRLYSVLLPMYCYWNSGTFPLCTIIPTCSIIYRIRQLMAFNEHTHAD